MDAYTPVDPDFEPRVRSSFAQQSAMALLGASLALVEPGTVEITLPFRSDLTQQHGYVHAGILTAIADTACGYAAYTLMPAGTGVLSVEFKMNLLRPAAGERFVARGTVLKPGRTLTVTRADVLAFGTAGSTLVAAMQATIISR
ncbi:MAG TPA: PaaI family thioesterase [Thermoanaerobaculia bacterium]|nr:PaaI family thioesterase [Thermoanaerobaculia bacterium]